MYLESLHKTIKHFYLQGRKCKCLDKTINALITLVRDKNFERVIKFEKHKRSEKIQKIINSHSRAQSISENSIKLKSENQWYVTSTRDTEHTYIVEKVENNCTNHCELKCQKCMFCVHSFKCSCSDNVINYNMCKHIHACCQHYFSTSATAVTNNITSTSHNYEVQKSISGHNYLLQTID